MAQVASATKAVAPIVPAELCSPGVPESPGDHVALVAGASSVHYRPDIDGLRAVSVTAVVLYHLNDKLLPGGFVGVDVFFAISGFVVAASLLRKASPTLPQYFAAFYSRRVKRLSPALALVVGLAGLEIALLVPKEVESLHEFYLSGIFGLFGAANAYSICAAVLKPAARGLPASARSRVVPTARSLDAARLGAGRRGPRLRRLLPGQRSCGRHLLPGRHH